MATPSEPDLAALSVAAEHLRAAKSFQLAGFVMMVYDHVLTFSDEVDRIWRPKFTGATWLFLINRYCTLLQFIVILTAFHSPTWSPETCRRYAPAEGATTIALVAVCEVIMILRVYALYNRNVCVLVLLGVLWLAQVILSSIGLVGGFPVPLPRGILVGCIFTGSSGLFPMLWVMPLVTDSAVFFLTLFRTREYLRESASAPMLHIFMRDGLMYFALIFVANLVNVVIFYSVSAADLKAIGASFSQFLTSTMISRLVLNLRVAHDTTTVMNSADWRAGDYRNAGQSTMSTFMAKTIGNLGQDVGIDSDIVNLPNITAITSGVDDIPMLDFAHRSTEPDDIVP